MCEVFFLGTARRTDSQRSASSGGTVIAMGMEGRAKGRMAGEKRGRAGAKRRRAMVESNAVIKSRSSQDQRWINEAGVN